MEQGPSESEQPLQRLVILHCLILSVSNVCTQKADGIRLDQMIEVLAQKKLRIRLVAQFRMHKAGGRCCEDAWGETTYSRDSDQASLSFF
ncbi:hypothetical protein AYM40_34605 [Paraburkholderia phytofirmans OLGA172]|uniref:Uncharacterized protein n=1 Tax=Paraburkholderia phytofirmans OLGA172 TaxID=1417228 RepID=A0A160FWB6_9BURK|nr:hypothetical protein AYM40_34605 [Paraburkholderia phytofirmans OLGA172]